MYVSYARIFKMKLRNRYIHIQEGGREGERERERGGGGRGWGYHCCLE